MPVITKFIKTSPFALGALNEFASWAEEGVLPLPEALELAKGLLRNLISVMDVATLVGEAGYAEELRRAKGARYSYSYIRETTSPVSRIIGPGQLSELFRECFAHSWDDLLRTLPMRIAAQSSFIPPSQFQHLWLPFLHELVEVLNGAAIPLTTLRYQQLILTILESYVERYVGPEPPREIDWTLPRVSCSHTSDCSQLNAFLQSSTQSTARFQMGKKRRQHLHQLLDHARIPCTHTTDRSTYPETLVVTETISKGLARAGWEARLKNAREALEGLRSVLGTVLAEDYAKIMRMVAAAPTDQRAAVGAGNGVSGSAAPTTTGTLPPPLMGLPGHAPSGFQRQGDPNLQGLAAIMRQVKAQSSVAGVKRKAGRLSNRASAVEIFLVLENVGC